MPCVPRLLAAYQARSRTAARASSATTGTQPQAGDAVLPDTDAPSEVVRPEAADLPEYQPLFLPSSLQQDDLDSCVCDLANIEVRLRDGQLHDALDKVRVHLHIKSRLLAFKARNIRHQGPNTRAMSQIDANEGKIIMHAEKYRAARSAKLRLSGPGPWEREWRLLAASDVRCMRESEPDVTAAGLETLEQQIARVRGETRGRLTEAPRTLSGESRRQVSWIWNTADVLSGGEEVEGMEDGVCLTSSSVRGS